MSNEADDETSRKNVLAGKFFTIVDGDEGLCLVGVDPPIVHYLSHYEILLTAQHLNIPKDKFSHEYIALRLSSNWGGSEDAAEFDAELVAWLKEIRGKNTDGSFGTGDQKLVNACLIGPPPMSLLVGRGKR
jgi:hypothetical protein